MGLTKGIPINKHVYVKYAQNIHRYSNKLHSLHTFWSIKRAENKNKQRLPPLYHVVALMCCFHEIVFH
jgi:hypothetical protein